MAAPARVFRRAVRPADCVAFDWIWQARADRPGVSELPREWRGAAR